VCGRVADADAEAEADAEADADADADTNHPQMEKVVWGTSAEPLCTHTTHTRAIVYHNFWRM